MDGFRGIDLIQARQFVSLVLMFMSICIVIVFTRYLIAEAKVFGWKNIRRDRLNQAAIALMVYFVAMVVARGWASYLYEVLAEGGNIIAIEDTYPIAFTSSIIAFIGGLCIIRVFTESNWSWFVAFVFVSLATTVVVLW